MSRVLLALLFAAATSGCVTADAINRNYDLSRVRRIGVLAFDYGRHEPFGAEDIFAKHLLERGYQVVERARLEAILKEQRLNASGLLAPGTAKGLGRMLGVDALVLGQVTTFEPERKMVLMVDSHLSKSEPVFETKKEKQPDGSVVEVKTEIGKKVTHESKKMPLIVPVDAEVGLAVKLVDVESGEVVWVGSDTSQGVNGPLATESIAAYLVKRLAKKWLPRASTNPHPAPSARAL